MKVSRYNTDIATALFVEWCARLDLSGHENPATIRMLARNALRASEVFLEIFEETVDG